MFIVKRFFSSKKNTVSLRFKYLNYKDIFEREVMHFGICQNYFHKTRFEHRLINYYEQINSQTHFFQPGKHQ